VSTNSTASSPITTVQLLCTTPLSDSGARNEYTLLAIGTKSYCSLTNFVSARPAVTAAIAAKARAVARIGLRRARADSVSPEFDAQ